MTIASIDIGSNSVILLIADLNCTHKRFVPVKNYYTTPRIGKNLSPGEDFPTDSVIRLKETLIDFISIAKSNEAEIILPAATQAFRKAKNASLIVEEIKNELGIDIRILSGQEEGLLTFLGATSIVDSYSGYMIDIGGGSTEIILSDNGKISFSHSYNFGAVSLSELYNTVPPIKQTGLEPVKKYIEDAFRKDPPTLINNSQAIAVAGTPTTLACMHLGMKEFDEAKIEEYELTRGNIISLIVAMTTMTPPEILECFGSIVAGREDIILTGAVILDSIMELLNIEYIFVSTRGLRHGIIYNYLNKVLQ